MTDPTPGLRERVARVIADSLGIAPFEDAFANKAAWTACGGKNALGRFVDVNEPFRCDYLDAADEILAMFAPAAEPGEIVEDCLGWAGQLIAIPTRSSGCAGVTKGCSGVLSPVDWGYIESAADQLKRAASEIERLAGEVERLREALTDAADCVEHWGSYAGEYFQTKWDLTGEVERIRASVSSPVGEGRNE